LTSPVVHVGLSVGQRDGLVLVEGACKLLQRKPVSAREKVNVGVRPCDLLRQARAERGDKPRRFGGRVRLGGRSLMEAVEDHRAPVHPTAFELVREEDRLVDGRTLGGGDDQKSGRLNGK